MKVILTGSSGFVGQEILHQCLENPSISSVVVLTRRKLSEDHAKLKVIILDDFNVYPDHVINELNGSEACIWFVIVIGLKKLSTQVYIQD